MNQLYFAYGSNLLVARLQARTPRARLIGTGIASGFTRKFHKIGTDGSGKADAFFTGNVNHKIRGAVYVLPESERPFLDFYEGDQYRGQEITIQSQHGELKAFTYVVRPGFIDYEGRLLPFHWYKYLVLAGACQHGMPRSYLELIAAAPSKDDSDQNRNARNLDLIKWAIAAGLEFPERFVDDGPSREILYPERS